MNKNVWTAAAEGKVCIVMLVLIFLVATPCSSAGRIISKGPILTVTLKDPEIPSYSSYADDSDDVEILRNPWFNLGNLSPKVMWSLQTEGKPLPNWFPNWHSFRTTIGYQYEMSKRTPTFIDADFKFSSERAGVDLQLQPMHEFGSKQNTLSILASRGAAAYLMATFATKKERLLQMVKGCYQASLPYASVGAVRVTPTVDLTRGQASCLVEATTGSQRTKAVVDLEYNNPTLTVIHSLNERNTIAPKISLYDATILYQWNLALDSGSIRTSVNPTSDVRITWTDLSMNGKWVTDLRMPLAGTTLKALAADVRVQRQFNF